MQDPTLFPQLQPQFPEHEQLPCPRCNSTNTKFCYYNNYNLSQPRHFCKNCRRYWTKGGALRNVPVGGGCRKTTKRATKRHHPPPPIPTKSSEFCAAPSSSTAQTSPTQNPILNHGPGTLSGSGPTREPLPGLGPNRFLGVPAGSFTLPSSSATTKSLGFCSAPSRSPVQISPTHYPNLNHEPGLASGSGPNRLLGTPTVSFTHPSSATTSPSQISPTQNRIPNREPDSVSGSGPNQVLGVSARGFTSLLVSNGQFGSLLDGLNPDGSGGEPGRVQKYAIPGSSPGSGHGLGQELGSDPNPRVDSSSCGGSSNGWPDLAIYTPGFH